MAAPQTAQNWLADLPAIEASEADPEVDALEMGAAMYAMYNHGNGDGRVAGVTDPTALANFETWLSTTGNALLADWYAGSLDPADEKYLWILRIVSNAHYYSYKDHPDHRFNGSDSDAATYFNAAKAAGEAAVIKGYLGEELLTDADIEDIREFVTLLDVANTAVKAAPIPLGVMPHNPPPIGTPAPDFYLPTAETVMARPSYTDDIELYDTEGLNAYSIERLLHNFQAYTSNGDGTVSPIPNTMHPDDAANPSAEYVRLSDYEGDRPVLLLIADKSDGYWYRGGARDIEAIKAAYGDEIVFYMVNHSYGESAGLSAYTGAHQGNDICLMQPHTQEEFAFVSKQVDITDCSVSTPTLIDGVGGITRSAYSSNGGGGGWILIDKNGDVAAHPSIHMYNGLQVDGVRTNPEVPRDLDSRDGYVNVLEQEVRLLLANDGVAVTDSYYRTPDADGFYALERDALFTQRRTYFLQSQGAASFIITAINGNTITAEKTFPDLSTKTYTLTVGDHTDMQDYLGHIDINGFSVGNPINVLFYGDTYDGTGTMTVSNDYHRGFRYLRFNVTADASGSGNITPRVIYKSNIPGDLMDRDVWALGTITNIDVPSNEIEVTMRTVDANTFPGYRYYSSAPSATLTDTAYGAASLNMPVVESWVNATEPVVYTLDLKDSSNIYLNGLSTDINGVSIGQKVAFNFFSTTNRTVIPMMVRASTPVAVGDVIPAKLSFAEGLYTDTIEILFDSTLDQTTAETTGNYAVSGGQTVTNAVLSGNTVTLTVAPGMTTLSDYTVTVNHVEDLAGNPILADTSFDFTFDDRNPQVNSFNMVDPNTLTLTFNKSVTQASTTNVSNYAIAPLVSIYRVDYNPSTPNQATLRTGVMAEDVVYTLTVNGIQDSVGRTIATDSQVAFVSGPITWLAFDENTGTTVTDLIGNLPDQTLLGGNTWSAGRSNSGLTTNGSNGIMLISNASAPHLNFNPANDIFSISVWFRTTTTGTAQNLVWKGYSQPEYSLYIGSDNKLYAQCGGTSVSIDSVVTDGNWHLATLTNDTVDMTLYLDDGTMSATVASPNSGGTTDIGIGRRTGNASKFIGDFDDLRFYDKALQPSEVIRLYNLFTVQEQWRFDRFGTTDTSGNYADAADFDGDGMKNLFEYFAGLDPVSPEPVLAAGVGVSIVSGELRVQFFKDASATDVNWVLESSTDLIDWTVDVDATLDASNLGIVGGTVEQFETTLPLGSAARFCRIRVE